MNSTVFYCSSSEEYGSFSHHHGHFLEACFKCRKPLGLNRDIFMYRGDMAFCSDECRQVQIETDEAKERRKNLPSASARGLRRSDAGSEARCAVAGAVSVA